jgi:hypothetical protein
VADFLVSEDASISLFHADAGRALDRAVGEGLCVEAAARVLTTDSDHGLGTLVGQEGSTGVMYEQRPVTCPVRMFTWIQTKRSPIRRKLDWGSADSETNAWA